MLALTRPIVFFDLETTGTDAANDRIVEIACIKLLPEGGRDRYVTRLNPGMPIPAGATAIHGICDDDVCEAPTFKQIARTLHEWIRRCDFGGYNAARFDLPVLVEEFLRAGIAVDFSDCRMIDPQQIFFKLEQRTLSAAYKFYCGKTLDGAHCAENDISATIEVLEAQLARYTNDLKADVDELHNFCAGGDVYVDYHRVMKMQDGHPCFTLGKHKGKRVADVFDAEPGYYDWMMKGGFGQHTKQKISEILMEQRGLKGKKKGFKI